MKGRPLACLLALAPLLPPALADDGSRLRVIEQKAALVQRVLEDSALAKRIAASASDEAKGYLAHARARSRSARSLVAEGRLQAGEEAIDEAVALIGKARSLVPDRDQATSDQRARYAALLESTQGLLASARRQAARAPAGAEPAEVARSAALIGRAEVLAGREHVDEAYRTLLEAERELLVGLTRLVGSATLDYTVRFESPEDEVRHETARVQSLRQLVPLALAALKPAPAAVRSAEELVQHAVQLQARAEAHAARGEFAAALASLRQATDALQRALRAAGLSLQAAQ
ncbi:MAG: hypothetical protein OEW96_08150 [Betaproteobacteria bacterium]|nr:hypothetical protein [Betaproteobacteria bacterium]